MRPLAYALKPITKKAFDGKSALFGKMIVEWPIITKGLGCEQAKPIKLNFPRGKNKGACLSLATSSSQAFTLQHVSPQILQRINQFFGYKAIEKINFIHQSVEPIKSKKKSQLKTASPKILKQVENTLSFVDEGEMKKALVALGKSVIHKEQTDSQQKK